MAKQITVGTRIYSTSLLSRKDLLHYVLISIKTLNHRCNNDITQPQEVPWLFENTIFTQFKVYSLYTLIFLFLYDDYSLVIRPLMFPIRYAKLAPFQPYNFERSQSKVPKWSWNSTAQKPSSVNENRLVNLSQMEPSSCQRMWQLDI